MTSADVARVGRDRAGAARVADRAIADGAHLGLLVAARLHPLVDSEEHAVAGHDLTLVSEVDRGKIEVLALDVAPDVELGPVADRERPHVLTRTNSPVVEVPELGALVAGIPLPELVAEREDALLGACLVFVATSASEAGVEPVLGDGVEQRHRLQAVARGACAGIGATATCRSTAAPTPRQDGHRACSRRGRGSRGPLGSCGRCRRASPRRGTAQARGPWRPGEGRRPSPCRRRTARRGCAARLRPRG